MIRYMLDTNACIGIMDQRIAPAKTRVGQSEIGEIAISQIVLHELEFGVCKSVHQAKNRAKLDHLLKYVVVADFTNNEAAEAALIRCELARSGKPIGPLDTLIAGHARALKATLVTHNTREFKRVAGLSVEDWEG